MARSSEDKKGVEKTKKEKKNISHGSMIWGETSEKLK